MKLVGEIVFLGIVECLVRSPVEIATSAFDRRPLRFVLTSDLIPKLVILWHATSSVYIVAGCDVSKEFVGVL